MTFAFIIQNQHDDGMGISFSADAVQTERLAALIQRAQNRRAA
jgi:hypothetical protein